MAFVELENVTKAYDSGWAAPVKALDRVSLIAEAGQWIAIMGPSGSGKTTLLNILGCLDQATEGAVRIDSVDTSTLTPRRTGPLSRRDRGLRLPAIPSDPAPDRA